MNTNEAIHNRNAETAPRLRYNNDSIGPNHIVYPYSYPTSYPIPPLFYPISQPVIMTTNHSQVPSINANDQSSEQSGIMSPSSDTSVSQPPYRISTWQDIADIYEGNEEKPKCGKLKDNVYFTQRSASSDMYMLFDKKSDYINNFVNYYFSDKNLARDHKLVALMDEKGIVPLSALVKFPKLHQIDTTVEDLIKAFQNNNFVGAVDIGINEKGAQRRDRLCSADVVNKNGFEKNAFNELNNETSNNQINVSVSDLNITIQNENVGGQSQSYYVYNQPALIPAIYSQQPGIMPTGSTINGLPPFNPYVMTNFPYGTHSTANPVGLNQSQNIYPGSLVWSVSSSDYNNHGLISHIPYNHNNVVNTNHGANARFLSNTGFNSVQTASGTEPAGNRIN